MVYDFISRLQLSYNKNTKRETAQKQRIYPQAFGFLAYNTYNLISSFGENKNRQTCR